MNWFRRLFKRKLQASVVIQTPAEFRKVHGMDDEKGLVYDMVENVTNSRIDKIISNLSPIDATVVNAFKKYLIFDYTYELEELGKTKIKLGTVELTIRTVSVTTTNFYLVNLETQERAVYSVSDKNLADHILSEYDRIEKGRIARNFLKVLEESNEQ